MYSLSTTTKMTSKNLNGFLESTRACTLKLNVMHCGIDGVFRRRYEVIKCNATLGRILIVECETCLMEPCDI